MSDNFETEEIKELRAIVECKRVQIDKLKRMICNLASQLPMEVQVKVQNEIKKLEETLG